MSLSVESRRIVYNGNGSTTVFAIPFSFQGNSSYVGAKLYDTTMETFAAWVISTNYTISGSNLTALTAPATGFKLVIYSLVPLSQGKDFGDTSPFLPSSMEDGLDILSQQIQQVDEAVKRAPKFNGATSLSNIDLPATLLADATVVVNPAATGFIWGPTVASISTDAAAAAASASAASGSASSASTSAGNAATSEANALASELAAAASAAAALVSELAAAVSAAAAAAAALTAIGTEKQEFLTGVFGTDTVFTMSQTPLSAAVVKAFLGPNPQEQTVDYSISGSTITFTGVDVSASLLFVFYRY